MDIPIPVLLIFFLYKALTLLAGLLIVFMGYQLFLKGIYTDAGEIQAEWKQNKLLLKRAAPGTFFSLFGAIIICFAVFKGVNLQQSQSGNSKNNFNTESIPPLPDSLILK